MKFSKLELVFSLFLLGVLGSIFFIKNDFSIKSVDDLSRTTFINNINKSIEQLQLLWTIDKTSHQIQLEDKTIIVNQLGYPPIGAKNYYNSDSKCVELIDSLIKQELKIKITFNGFNCVVDFEQWRAPVYISSQGVYKTEN